VTALVAWFALPPVLAELVTGALVTDEPRLSGEWWQRDRAFLVRECEYMGVEDNNQYLSFNIFFI
jgi:hypothetical protein